MHVAPHDGVAASVAVLGSQPLQIPLGRVPLPLLPLFVVLSGNLSRGHRPGPKNGQPMPRSLNTVNKQHLWLASLLTASLGVFRMPLYGLATMAFNDEHYSHIVLIPVISACLVYAKQKDICQKPWFCLGTGLPLLVATLTTYSATRALSQRMPGQAGCPQ
jgi:hypothetical protein